MTISDHEIHSLAYLNWPYDKLARWLSREKGFTITEQRIELAFNRAQKKTHRRPRGVRAGDLVTIRPEVQNEAPIAVETTQLATDNQPSIWVMLSRNTGTSASIGGQYEQTQRLPTPEE